MYFNPSRLNESRNYVAREWKGRSAIWVSSWAEWREIKLKCWCEWTKSVQEYNDESGEFLRLKLLLILIKERSKVNLRISHNVQARRSLELRTQNPQKKAIHEADTPVFFFLLLSFLTVSFWWQARNIKKKIILIIKSY